MAPDLGTIFVLFDRHGAGRVEGTTTSWVLAQGWRSADPAYHHVVERQLAPSTPSGATFTQAGTQAAQAAPRRVPGGFLGAAPLYVLHEQHGDGSVDGVTLSWEVARAWHVLDSGYRLVVPTVLNHLDFVSAGQEVV